MEVAPWHAGHAVPRRLTNPFVALADDLDSISEEKTKPKTGKGWAYVMLTPWVGFGIFFLGFPVLWWNERRATGRRKSAQSQAQGVTVHGTVVSENAEKGEVTVKGQAVAGEGQSLLGNPEESYQQAVESFEERHCGYACCRVIRSCFDAMPELQGSGDLRTYFFRVMGVSMIFTGIDMMLSPTYFLFHTLTFFSFIIAAHLAICACKSACCLSLGTIVTSYVLHRPGVVAALVLSFVGISALSVYYNVPVHSR